MTRPDKARTHARTANIASLYPLMHKAWTVLTVAWTILSDYRSLTHPDDNVRSNVITHQDISDGKIHIAIRLNESFTPIRFDYWKIQIQHKRFNWDSDESQNRNAEQD